MEYPLIVENLRKTFKSGGEVIEAVKGISFKVKKGEIFGLLGPNGAGKTTTINMLTGILTPDSGKILFFGKEPSEASANRINTSTAYNALNGILSVEQNLKVYAKLYNVQDAEKKINDLLVQYQVEDIKKQHIFDLSSGQKTRVNLCKCLINDPEIIFLDEATAGLDPHIANEVRKQIKSLKATIVYTSHIMYEVEQLCSRIAFLHKGKILTIDTPDGAKSLVKHSIVVLDLAKQPKDADKKLKGLDVLSHNNNRLVLRIQKASDLQKLLQDLSASGFVIKDFRVKRPSLDEVFIKIARGEL